MGRKRKERTAYDKENDISEEDRENDDRSERMADKHYRREDKHDYKLHKIDAKSQKAISTAMKRDSLSRLIKWFLIAIGVFYALSKFGGLNLGGILDKVKGIMP